MHSQEIVDALREPISESFLAMVYILKLKHNWNDQGNQDARQKKDDECEKHTYIIGKEPSKALESNRGSDQGEEDGNANTRPNEALWHQSLWCVKWSLEKLTNQKTWRTKVANPIYHLYVIICRLKGR